MFEENTVNVYDKARIIKDKMREFDILINKFYSKMVNMPSNNIWSGASADKYIKRVLLDKAELLKYSDGIKSIATELQKFASDTESVIKTLEDSI